MNTSLVSKVKLRAIEASHTRLMRQFEVFAIITPPIALMSAAACLARGWLCLFTLIPLQTSQRLSMARYATNTATEIQTQRDANPSPKQHLPAGVRHAIY